MIDKLDDLLKKFGEWMQTKIPDSRVDDNDAAGRTWFLASVEYKDTLKLEDLRKFTYRRELNKEFTQRYLEKSVQSAKGISALKVEISALYSFNKCFVQRYKGRLHYYRDDLSQKGARNMASCAQAQALFNEFDKNLST
jgi:hypothetical protein